MAFADLHQHLLLVLNDGDRIGSNLLSAGEKPFPEENRMESSSLTNRFAVCLFGMALSLLCVNEVLYGTGLVVDAAKNVPRLVAFALFTCSCLLKARCFRIEKAEIALLLLILVNAIMGRGMALNLLMIVLLGLNARQFPRKQVAVCLAVAACAAIALTLFFNLSGVVADQTIMAHYADGGERIRHTFGFYNSNTAAIIFAGAILLPPALGGRAWQWVLCAVAVAVAYYFTTTRTILLLMGLFLVFALASFLLIRKGKNKHLGIGAVIVGSGAVVFSAIMPLLAKTPFNNLLSYRPAIAKNLLGNTSLFDLLFGTSGSVAVDNSYLLLLCSCGVFILLLAVFCMLRSVWHAAQEGDYQTVSLLLALMMAGVFESFLIRPELALCLGFWSLAFCLNGRVSTATSRLQEKAAEEKRGA